jgi:hypothetical protein
MIIHSHTKNQVNISNHSEIKWWHPNIWLARFLNINGGDIRVGTTHLVFTYFRQYMKTCYVGWLDVRFYAETAAKNIIHFVFLIVVVSFCGHDFFNFTFFKGTLGWHIVHGIFRLKNKNILRYLNSYKGF